MLNELLNQLRRYDMVQPGDTVTCAVSGGADSMALLWGMYLLRDKLGIQLTAAHFNHNLRGAESQRDEEFVRDFCQGFEIPLSVGSGQIKPGKKGLEAAARDARYAFLNTQPGKIATAHTADDNAETVLMHLVRGTGLKGLGGITPVNGRFIRPMLTATRQQVLSFLEEYHIPYVEDSSNSGDDFLRNRLRHHVMPLLKEENPRLAENLSAMAMRLRLDEAALAEQAAVDMPPSVSVLRAMPPAVRSRALEACLKAWGVQEPESAHIGQAEALVFSENPSARAVFPGGITVGRNYAQLELLPQEDSLPCILLEGSGAVELPEAGFRVRWDEAARIENGPAVFTFRPEGKVWLRSRMSGDRIRLNVGTRSLKKLFIDRKIPANSRQRIPVLADDLGVIGVYGIGIHLDRIPEQLPAMSIWIENL